MRKSYKHIIPHSERMDVKSLTKNQPYMWRKEKFEEFIRKDLQQYNILVDFVHAKLIIDGPILVEDFSRLREKMYELGLEDKIEVIIITNVHDRKR